MKYAMNIYDMLIRCISVYHKKITSTQVLHQGDFWEGGGAGTSVEILFEISPECRNTFLPKSRIFRKFSRYFYTITPKITFYCIFINKFHKNFEKSAQKFFTAPSAPKTCRNISIFYPQSVDGPPRGVTPPPKNQPVVYYSLCTIHW